ncbi:MAG: hypothetical protein K9L68_09335 [Spirochaetales bacterium]|nr:hypothetical protein [Spirochaetales bacterium]MCF7938788.1 hypothetical protein [Spirochaetales bacterium]
MQIHDIEAVEHPEDGQEQFTSIHKRKDGTRYPVEVNASFFFAGDLRQFFDFVSGFL